MRLSSISLAALVLLAGVTQQAGAVDARRLYIVQLAAKPVASYTGDVAGLAATKPAAGQHIDVSASNVQAYVHYLDQQREAVLTVVADAPLLHSYSVVFNGFSAMLSDAEVRKLKKNSGVAVIKADEPRYVQTNYTPTFLGLDKNPGGLWQQLGGKGAAGEDMIIGMLDTGAWPESPAYADRVDSKGAPTFDASGTLAYGPPPARWKGSCTVGEGISEHSCNNKLIGAQFFNASFMMSGYLMHPSDFMSARDSLGGADGLGGHGGHGTHTSTTAGGNNGVPASVAGTPMGTVSGMAPRARIAMYKVCWTYISPFANDGTGSQNSCFSGDSVAAVEKAVLDGVNAISYSIGGSSDDFDDPVDQAFLGAVNAGVFVSVAGGNAGPADTVAHVGPWMTTVAASTHNRLNGATATLGNGAKYIGASLDSTALPATTAMLAQDAGLVPYAQLTQADRDARRQCFSATDRDSYGGSDAGALDASLAAGKVIVCDRGVSARLDKSKAVLAVGGVGMILVDNGAGIVSEVHSVPTVHVSNTDGAAIKTYVSTTAKPNAALSVFTPMIGALPAPMIASFSSRGPNLGDPNTLKPDLSAPGVNILAAVSPTLTADQRAAVVAGTGPAALAWDFYSGTSMATPHVAGVAMLLKQMHPTWSPAAIKSALMTTATLTVNDGGLGMANGQLPWSQGAGHIAPNSAADPGLIYDLTPADYLRFLCSEGSQSVAPASCQSAGALQPYNLNLPSITDANVLGKVSITRTVTNVGSSAATYNASAALPGFTVTVSPASLVLAPGAQASFTVNLTRTTAAIGAWQYGALVWNDGTHTVRSPLTARASSIATIDSVYSEATTGSKVFTIGTGFSGPLAVVKGGLVAAQRDVYTVVTDQSGDDGQGQCMAGGSPSVIASTVTVPPGTLLARFALFNADTTGYQAGAIDDLDLLVFDSNGLLVAYSGSVTADENVSMAMPAAGTYRVCVTGFAPHNGSSTFTLSSWIVAPGSNGGGFKVLTPSTVFTGGTASVAASWSGLDAGKRYSGAVGYLYGGAVQTSTVFGIDTTDPVPLMTARRAGAGLVGRQ
ncbi:S8 family serine peptidase [Rugamonas sp.]|uniref:S8 family serine peptidase n=1 Tax=Rugamonas sp. TaxID=1926287 RepID=UPI0025DEA48B|nr:S8 family serine peptidase [Rugamonas sp.]